MILMPLMMLKIEKINSLMTTCLNVYACDFELYCQGLLVSSVTNLAIFEGLGAPGCGVANPRIAARARCGWGLARGAPGRFRC